MAMFDPVYVTEVLNDILGRRGLKLTLVPKDSQPPVVADLPEGQVTERSQEEWKRD